MIWRALMRAACLVGLALLATALRYSYANISGHTGISPLLVSGAFVPTFSAGALDLIVRRRATLAAPLAVTTGALGIAFGILLEQANILHVYEDWIDLGMPDPNPSAQPIVLAYAIASAALLLTIGIISYHRARAR